MTQTTIDQTKCRSCGRGTLRRWSATFSECNYCGASPESFKGTSHVHKMGMRVNGMTHCVGDKVFGCTVTEYDSQWGAGIFSDWPVGHHKPYGA